MRNCKSSVHNTLKSSFTFTNKGKSSLFTRLQDLEKAEMIDESYEWTLSDYRSRTNSKQACFDRERFYFLNFDFWRMSPTSSAAATYSVRTESASEMDRNRFLLESFGDSNSDEEDRIGDSVSPPITHRNYELSSDTCSACGGGSSSTTTATSTSLLRSVQPSIKRYFSPTGSRISAESRLKRIKADEEVAC